MNKKSKATPKRSDNYFLTENTDLIAKLNKQSEVQFQVISKDLFQKKSITNSLIIFDAEYVTYSEIFSLMKQLKGEGNLFRIRPPECDFIIGSDQSDEKGGVIIF